MSCCWIQFGTITWSNSQPILSRLVSHNLRFWKPFDPWRYLHLFLQRTSTSRPCKLLGTRLQFHQRRMKGRPLILPKNANMKVLSHGTTMQLEANGLISVGLTRVFLSKRPKACGRPVMPNATIWKMFPYTSLSVGNLSQRVRPKIHGRIRYVSLAMWPWAGGCLCFATWKGNMFRASPGWFYPQWWLLCGSWKIHAHWCQFKSECKEWELIKSILQIFKLC